MKKLSALVLAAGEGTRMKSRTPKVLHAVCGVPMAARVLDTLSKLGAASTGIVVGHRGEEVRRAIEAMRPAKKFSFIFQRAQKGSGHAVQSAGHWIRKACGRDGDLLVLCADTPLISAETLRSLLGLHRASGRAATLCSMAAENPFGYGRILRGPDGTVQRIVEEKDASEPERRIREVNTGIYCFKAVALLKALPRLKNRNAKREYYLTDVIEILRGLGESTTAMKMEEGRNGRFRFEAMGINTREELAAAERLRQKEILSRWMREGVTILNPEATVIEEEVRLSPDTVIFPGSHLSGKTKIGYNCAIGPHTLIEDSVIGDSVSIRASFIYGSRIESGAQIGPFAHLRPGTLVRRGARIGNFTEVKNSRIGRETKVSHLSYVGDADLGDDINVGAGAITCNFDGKKKHRTVVGSGSFIGSNVNLIAPVRVGARSVVGAGSTITRNVPSDSLAIERSPQVNKIGWTKKKRG